ncbi:N-glycosylase/DNA lyase [Candidatus Woesearchaeota archaeon]|jgi:N-glycosylase/DNA lyase|nr:N-glycosylase/DNA lyase [Candidatus Woesearchaeota archaeon]MBT4387403.1 N-glycosylase/DNA lyase [Candidatus Woesearchaeota archaeon]MBT4595780.1 N-glycosylase/DNA lyase [Candidatus Woesearchaeota archaeon]MBT5741371.1 N-glycosylase/DNA lyase [Candidatus Woesearchaeota archaeon]MBT6505812.1 N-glycosylase/DNA lyase [Candidatus Woesearchaeota archaeon]
MKELIQQVNQLKKTEIKNIIDKRMKEFSDLNKMSNEDWFSELCFCLTTANSSQKTGAKIQNELGFSGYYNLSLKELTIKLKELGHRFYNVRSQFIFEARKNKNIKEILSQFNDDFEKRDWLVNNVKGLGMKESSHFLRNTGHNNLAILDRHIIRALQENKLIPEFKTITKNIYLQSEKVLNKICDKTNLSQGELDLYLWYTKTGEVLK